jgi:hypothetical protein
MSRARNEYGVLVRNDKGAKPLGRPGCRWKDDIRMNLRKTGPGYVYLSHLDRDQ